jgi:hypothetical protein
LLSSTFRLRENDTHEGIPDRFWNGQAPEAKLSAQNSPACGEIDGSGHSFILDIISGMLLTGCNHLVERLLLCGHVVEALDLS